MNNGLHEHLKIFVAIHNARSLTAASIATGIAQATLSRQLAALEAHLGGKLFQRSTRAISLTDRGSVFLSYAKRILELVEEAENSVQADDAQLSGQIRVACSNGFSRKLIIPALARWQAQHPALQIDLRLSDQVSALIEEGVELAFRIAPLRESNLIAKPIGISQRILVATPAYLKSHPPITKPEHLAQQECLLFTGSAQPNHWPLNGGLLSTAVQGRLSLSSMDAIYDAALASLGIALLPSWFCQAQLQTGQLIQLLAQYPVAAQTIHAVSSNRSTRKTAAFIRFIQEEMAKQASVWS